MPRRTVGISESALEDLSDIQDWYSEQGVAEIGVRFVREIVARIEHLAEHPDMGRIVPEFNRTALRELIHPPYRIVYRRAESSVQVIRVWRSERLLHLAGSDEPESGGLSSSKLRRARI